ncbi:hypothetical protein [Pseudochrobactrum asaccharolyticum]|uniref:Uncharacterized protein n=1 Tax=Pseudochrobactrum asaccharolyticum TaxID=354351 RepID=A0A366DH74_9HYPH|nr:hypothetical protein [Pseudochrobactrum asaccharolyticum]RBO89295.1 hypothetical protein DFR47_11623 [Pseudochrobactrum asaccharolyticum]
MSEQRTKSDNDILFEQRLIEGMRSASDQAMSMSKWLIATLMTTNSAGLFFSFKVTIEMGKTNPMAVYAFIGGCSLALITGLFAFLNYQKAEGLYEELLFMSPQKRWDHLNIDKRGRVLGYLNTAGIISGILSMLAGAAGAYQLLQTQSS